MLIDIVFLLLMLWAVFKGIRKGLILSLFSLLAYVIGLAAAVKFSAVVANRLASAHVVEGKWLPFASFILVFLVVTLIVTLAGRFVQAFADTLQLGGLNTLAGILLYALLFGIVFSLILFYAVQLAFIDTSTTKQSIVYPYVVSLAPSIINALGTVIPFFKDVFGQLERFFEGYHNPLV